MSDSIPVTKSNDTLFKLDNLLDHGEEPLVAMLEMVNVTLQILTVLEELEIVDVLDVAFLLLLLLSLLVEQRRFLGCLAYERLLSDRAACVNVIH
jgi:hypothetical protein